MSVARTRLRRTRWAAVSAGSVIVALVVACEMLPQADVHPIEAGNVRPLDNVPSGDTADASIDCVGVLHVVELRGVRVANARRFGRDSSTLRTSARLADLAAPDLRSFCDWEACIRSNGYGHACSVNDGGWESCHVCSSASDCSGQPMSQDHCVARAADPTRMQCHVGLLQECLLQQALRGPGDPRVTRSCRLSHQACAGNLPGDLTAEALAAQHETDQVTIQEFKEEIAVDARREPNSSYVQYWQEQLALWEGGLPADDEEDAGDASAEAD